MPAETAEITLTPEQQTHVDGLIKQASEGAVTKFKTDSEAERLKAVPEKYELKFSDKTPLDPAADGVKLAAFAKAQGLTGEQAQAYVKHHEDMAAGLLDRQKEFMATQIAKWKTDTETDKTIGGANYQATLASAKRVMDRFAPEGSAFRKMLDETGYGNHPEWVRFVSTIGKAMGEDSGGGGTGGGKPAPKTNAEVFYGGTK